MPRIPTTDNPPAGLRVPGFEVLVGTHTAASMLPRHSHDAPTICCVLEGGFTEFYSGKAVDCHSGMVKVTPAGEPHWNRFDPVDTVGVRIDVDRARFEALPSVYSLLDERVFAPEAAFDGLAGRLIAEVRTPDEMSAVAVEGLLLELLSRLARSSADGPTDRAPWLGRARHVVHERYRESISLSDVAADVAVHPATLARAYRRTFGHTVGEHIRTLRLERAAHELASNTRPLSSIALDCGFYDQSHFSNAFRRRFRCTPLEYRQRFAPRVL